MQKTEMKARETTYRALTEARLDALCPISNTRYSVLSQAMRYSLLSGGKRLRPMLAFSAAEVLGESPEIFLDFACAIEMIHAYSLIHDDLPALDNDDYRRGKPTCHKAFGEAMAILAGDGLLTRACILLTSGIVRSNLKGRWDRAALYILERAGDNGMIAGQVLDISDASESIKDQTYLTQMHSLKTGCLIGASLCFPAVVTNNQAKLDILEMISECIGLAFQIKDDILDVEGIFEKTGKSTGGDSSMNKSTYATRYGIDKARIMLSEETEKAISLTKNLGENTDFLRYLIRLISDRDN